MDASDEQLKSEQILCDIKRRHNSKEVIDVEEQRVKVVVFISGGNRYAFYGSDIREILTSCEIAWVPGLPEFLPGLINVRGDIESVIDIHYFLGEGKADPHKSLIAMAVRGDFRSGVMIDSIEDVVDIPLSEVKAPLSTLNGAARDLVIGEIDHGGKMVSLLDIDKLAARVSL
ncbi:chemotaxis protein CheW [Geobacter sp. OR-1]|uniref:chemotaxis protein CheW n=1 Tax=Geobacter sp. OR-1 TaxID=1266765 RepID=UPI0005445112|nr:chemotaxis protein CheW [Geobacter sp. OR-1]GAM09101.1 chemotaxis protein CheW [Geobacter sp. OR-1]